MLSSKEAVVKTRIYKDFTIRQRGLSETPGRGDLRISTTRFQELLASPVPGWHLTMVPFLGTEVRLLEESQGMTLFAGPLARIFEERDTPGDGYARFFTTRPDKL